MTLTAAVGRAAGKVGLRLGHLGPVGLGLLGAVWATLMLAVFAGAAMVVMMP